MAGLSSRPGFKFFLVGVLGVLLMIPLLLVWALIADRQGRAAEVAREIGRDFGGEQTISGPYLVVPFTSRETVREATGQTAERVVRRHAVFSPDDLTIAAAAQTQILRRSIFGVPAYRTTISFAGRISSPDPGPLPAGPGDMLWSEAILALVISDPRGIKEPVSLKPEGASPIPFRPSLGPAAFGRGIHAPLAGFDPRQGLSFAFDLVLNGTGGLWFTPAARDTKVRIAADWPHPSFSGAFLPDERSQSGSGFSAFWRIPDLARNLAPSSVVAAGGGLTYGDPQLFGVRLYQPGTLYQLVERSLKYGILFIGTVFLAVFLMELRSRRSVHSVQYILVGLALALFFVLLLSLAEHVGFPEAYLAASVATVGLISLYVAFAMRSAGFALVLAVLLAILLALLHIILSLEDYALLAGAIASFIGLAVLMLTTTRIDWSAPRAG